MGDRECTDEGLSTEDEIVKMDDIFALDNERYLAMAVAREGHQKPIPLLADIGGNASALVA